MWRTRPFSFTSVISKIGTLCLPIQLVLSDPLCEENEMCVSYKNQYTSGWYIWFLLLIFLVALLCGVVFFCLQRLLRRRRMDSPRRTLAVFAVGDLDPVYGVTCFGKKQSNHSKLAEHSGTEAAVNPTVGIHLHTQNPELCPVPCVDKLGPPPPYEEILKSSQF
ncbi:transmembrane protein 207 isoform X1 [Manis javanica]|uniref:transmembrane protein 207 isoform X1 n=1 Tax=Manis javanica TaxID=9974 RepID=UPI003C6D5D74